jgi:hypothetical protein
MIACPVCGQPTGVYTDGVSSIDMPLIQFSYRGSKEYVPPRCERCYDKMETRRAARRQNGQQRGH